MNERIVITGIGVISPIGEGFEGFNEGLREGRRGGVASSVVALGDGLEAKVCEMVGFTPQKWLGVKGIRALDRSARLLCVAAQMALESVGKVLPEDSPGDDRLGLICGMIFGSVHSIASFDWSGLQDGVKYVNPMAFPNTVINSPAGQAAIKHRLRGINSTISSGLASSLQALGYAADFLRFGRADLLLAGGVEEIAEESYLGFRKNDWLSASGEARPFVESRDGVILGEGSALLAMETEASAVLRGATVLAEVAGVGTAQSAHSIRDFSPTVDAAAFAVQDALLTAGVKADEVAFVVSGASGSRAGDRLEAEVLRKVFGGRLEEIPVCAPKASFGEALGASGSLCAAAAVGALKSGILPPTVGAEEKTIGGIGLNRNAIQVRPGPCLVTAFSCDGSNAALVLRP